MAPLIGFVLGALIQRVVIEPIHNVAALSIVATFGLSLILQESVRITYGPTPGRILPPIQNTIPLFGVDYEVYRLFAAAVAILALGGFFLFLHHTKLGTWMRAVRHDRDTAVAMGIPAGRVYVLTFAIGFALAAVGGVVAAPITTVDFRGGVDILPFCFMAVIIGGLGNLPGTAAAAILLAFHGGRHPERRRSDGRPHHLAGADERRPAAAAARPVQGIDALMSAASIERCLWAIFAAFMLAVPWLIPGADQAASGSA